MSSNLYLLMATLRRYQSFQGGGAVMRPCLLSNNVSPLLHHAPALLQVVGVLELGFG